MTHDPAQHEDQSVLEKTKPRLCPFCKATPHHGLGKVEHCQLHGEPFQRFSIWCPHGCAKITRMTETSARKDWEGTEPDELARLRSRVAVLEKGLTFIAECITSNIKETDDAHALLVGSERYTGPAVDKIYNILTGIERIARKALENRND